MSENNLFGFLLWNILSFSDVTQLHHRLSLMCALAGPLWTSSQQCRLIAKDWTTGLPSLLLILWILTSSYQFISFFSPSRIPMWVWVREAAVALPVKSWSVTPQTVSEVTAHLPPAFVRVSSDGMMLLSWSPRCWQRSRCREQKDDAGTNCAPCLWNRGTPAEVAGCDELARHQGTHLFILDGKEKMVCRGLMSCGKAMGSPLI